MKAGRMRHQMQLQRPVRTVDGYIGETKTWLDVVSVPASIDSISGREAFAVDRELAGITYRITMRETPGIKVEADWRGVDVDTGWIYDFHSILPSHERAVLVLTASSGTAQP
jgi:head-tail adaptor